MLSFSSEFKPKKIKTENDKKAKKRKQDDDDDEVRLRAEYKVGLGFHVCLH